MGKKEFHFLLLLHDLFAQCWRTMKKAPIFYSDSIYSDVCLVDLFSLLFFHFYGKWVKTEKYTWKIPTWNSVY